MNQGNCSSMIGAHIIAQWCLYDLNVFKAALGAYPSIANNGMHSDH